MLLSFSFLATLVARSKDNVEAVVVNEMEVSMDENADATVEAVEHMLEHMLEQDRAQSSKCRSS